MKILVVSDTHGKIDNLTEVLNNIGDDISCLLHLGDCASDVNSVKWKFSKLKVITVRGNCDFSFDDLGNDEREKLINIGSKKIFMVHGDRYNVKSNLARLTYRAEEVGAEVCLFGHTHSPTIFTVGNITIMNPGSLSLPRGVSFPSYGMIDITNSGSITTSVVAIENGIYRVLDF